jgi:D-3-phosphoglycerate dehydrogenase
MIISITEGTDYNPQAIDLYSQMGVLHIFDIYNPIDWNIIHQSEVLIIRLKLKIDEIFLNKCNKLKYIITPTTGLDHIDLTAANKKHITVLSLKGETAFLNQIPSTAEHTWALIMALQRKLIPATEHTKTGKWNRDLFKGFNLKGKTIGIIGLGRVGKQVATYAKCFGMKVIYFDPFEKSKPKYGLKYNNVNDIFCDADVITIHVPLQEQTKELVGATQIQLMKKSATIINTSRGEIWNENAIAGALRNKAIAGVATDVLSDEFNVADIKDNILMQLQRDGYPIIITPHIAGATYDSMHQTELFMANKFNKLIHG